MSFSLWRGLALATVCAASVAIASADLLFDRGLPSINLNNSAGANRSNVSWADAGGVFTGDDFQLAGSGQYSVSDIQMWIVGDNTPDLSSLYSSLTFWMGAGGNSALTATSYTWTATKVDYPTTALNYESTGGSALDLWEIDWNTAGLVLNGGDLINFGVSGVTNPNGALGTSNYVFAHASNAGLSGTTQEGADGTIREWNADGSFSNTFNSLGNGWDKNSDTNVRVHGSRLGTPEPFTCSLMGVSALAGFIRMRRRKSA